ncbi:PHP domain-containing protein [Desulfatirhabdium butyrativorans]|uniref:PHP domain-containing protein n=1 Tax=Desulfatirhabdium butyrativorans TaxID=340467 RepID=UPI000423E135|nr:PHP domain-containing protein [Desulfatirhabdium butyrativorans]
MESEADAIIDLHVHSTASDGSLTPIEILRQAIQTGIKALALTDHDTIDGARELFYLPSLPIPILSGVEISVQVPEIFGVSGGCHLLGYGFSMDDPGISSALDDFQRIRMDRVPRILDRLETFGIHLSLEELQQRCPGGPAGRPHIASLMIEKGYARSIDEAFDRYLGTGKPAYIDKARMDARTAMTLIRNAGGVPVLAHPGLIKTRCAADTDRLIEWFRDNGLMGIEAWYPDHTAAQTDHYRALAVQNHLLVTGGTDFHGRIRPEITLGRGKGDFAVPYAFYQDIAATCQRLRQISRTNAL